MNKKKKLGRPRAKTLLVPSWAIKRIEELARDSGVAGERTLALALKFGLNAVKENYAQLIQCQASADELFFGKPEEPNESLFVARSAEETDQPGDTPNNVPVEPESDPERETEQLEQPEFEEATQNGSFATALQ